MSFEGRLVQWNEDRGFGFIDAADVSERVFVHISAFERGRVRPPLGTCLAFDVERDAQGRKRAVRVALRDDTRLADEDGRGWRPAPGRPAPARSRAARVRACALVALACVAVATGVRGLHRTRMPDAAEPVVGRVAPADGAVVERLAASDGVAAAGRCDGRLRCSQMHSCAEATWFLQHCLGVQMDGDHDGVPCEEQWCTARR